MTELRGQPARSAGRLRRVSCHDVAVPVLLGIVIAVILLGGIVLLSMLPSIINRNRKPDE